MRIVSLSSGSKGNCIAVESGAGTLLVDCGIGIRTLKTRAKAGEVNLDNVLAVIATHEHTDHVRGIPLLGEYVNAPIYMHPRSYCAMTDKNFRYAGDNMNYEMGFDIGGFKITPFRSPHDSEYCVGYRIENEGQSVTVATDLGFITGGAMNCLRGSDAVILESNHDMGMLRTCSYPFTLKQRIMSNVGHLSNDAAAETVKQLVSRGTERFMLAHLSENSNTPSKAYDTVYSALKEIGAEGDTELKVAYQRDIAVIDLDKGFRA